MPARNEKDRQIEVWQKAGMEGVAKIEEVSGQVSTSVVPKHVTEAICHVASLVFSADRTDPKLDDLLFRATLGLMGNLYRAGYKSGMDDAKTLLHVGKG